MSLPKTERDVDFSNQDRTKVSARGYEGDIEYTEWEEVVPGVRCKTWEFKDVDASEKDGALIEIQSGVRTPIQYVETDKAVFNEVPLKGKLIFVSLSPQGELSAYKVDMNQDDNSYMMEVKKGWLMSWYACKDQPACEVLEYEEPGFSQIKLPTVETGVKQIGNTPIPDKFWQLIKQLEQGIEDNPLIQMLNQ